MRIPLFNQLEQPKAKVVIQVILTEDDRILVNCTSKNIITFLGMLNMAIKSVNPSQQAFVERPNGETHLSDGNENK